MSIHTINPNQLNTWLQSKEAFVIDVREPAEHSAHKIKGASLISLGNIDISTLPDVGDKKIVLHCHSGRRSMQACEKLLKQNNHLELYNLEGGIMAWEKAGYPTEKSEHSFLPLDRQVQLAIGLLLIFFNFMGYYHTPIWFIMTGFIGIGLSIAGVTGFCGLAMVIAKMPWNQKSS
jgi:rhodanese-related sulfurtransferase